MSVLCSTVTCNCLDCYQGNGLLDDRWWLNPAVLVLSVILCLIVMVTWKAPADDREWVFHVVCFICLLAACTKCKLHAECISRQSCVDNCHAATLEQKSQIKRAISPSHSKLTLILSPALVAFTFPLDQLCSYCVCYCLSVHICPIYSHSVCSLSNMVRTIYAILINRLYVYVQNNVNAVLFCVIIIKLHCVCTVQNIEYAFTQFFFYMSYFVSDM